MFALGLLFSLASTGLSMYGAHQQGKAAVQQANYQNDIQRARAANLENEFLERSTRQRINDRTARSNLIARQGRSGITSAGAPELILGRAAAAQELAIADAARGANQQASDARHAGKIALFEGQQAKSAARLSMLGIGLQGASQAFSSYSQGRHQGAI
jgi:hypothetical protein